MLAFLELLKKEAISWARYDSLKEPAEQVKAGQVKIATQLRITEMLLEFPQRLAFLNEQKLGNATKVTQMKNSQEGGEI